MSLVAIVGRPNVGKSTIVNRIASGQPAIVDELSGVTRDRNYIKTDWSGKSFTIVDTGGLIFDDKENLIESIRQQAFLAVEEADAIIFVVDGKTGLLHDDKEIANILRQKTKPIFLVVNKLDDISKELDKFSFYSLGLGEPHAISAMHGLGIGDLLDELVKVLPPEKVEKVEGVINVAIIGRPNAGKSSICNRLLGEERVIVSNIPGTTRDTIDTVVERGGKSYLFIDTAGLRRRKKIKGVEYYGMVRVLRAIDRADIVLLVLDSSEGVTGQDQKIAEIANDRDCGVMVLLNKWDLIDAENLNNLYHSLEKKLRFISYAPVLKVSALKNKGISKIYPMIDKVANEYFRQVSTPQLNNLVQAIKTKGHTVSKGRKKLNLLYATQIKTGPPTFLFFVNEPSLINVYFKRYLTSEVRKFFSFKGVPVKLLFRKKS
ncbi:ribosome biogenesis GTPase Der [Candidatus Oleimmundimicrobium sp.]|uniref:ribosome biogenesis GTPase Der n=1 Tax=Candidatus Oleimmundimicrobium sp. TaxID=3060597 RepID=UPI00271C480D|nr:ribosome biogenesis GTPase Der [Candidatus Oleimmundimicrobium sp.]MDO8885305.1 ribosome biogenesis GTPase Der [Candidatus Oleimmundimicrobium sp.]